MINKIKNLFENNSKYMKEAESYFVKIKEEEKKVANLSVEEMRKRVNEMKAELRKLVDEIPASDKMSVRKIQRTNKFPEKEKRVQEKLWEFLPEFYAMVNQVYKNKLGFGYHDVQYKAATILAIGQRLVEMKTGEGKTMTFQLPLALYSLAGRGSHLATVNDYLSKVGGEYAGHILSELGISVGVITPSACYKFISDNEIKTLKGEDAFAERKSEKMQIDAMKGLNLIETPKKQAYRSDVTFATNVELGFDYLRDNMAQDIASISQRELYFCIIDEADSILIDEARTPLIISSIPNDSDTEKYTRFANAVKELDEGTHYTVDHKSHSALLTDEGISVVEAKLQVANLWDDLSMAYHMENALKAKTLYLKNDQYLVRNGEVVIVDEFTGRIMSGRRYSEGLHQAIEAKEGVEIKQESKTMATITYQNFFRMYKVICGGSGTVMTESEEFYKIYGVECIDIPTNKPSVRKDKSDRVFKNEQAKFRSVVKDIAEQYKVGRPVLIGTVSVEKSEYLSKLLDQEGVVHEVLNAKYHEQESRIVTGAGKKGSVTVATNMAGRGTDIVIGGGSRGDEAWKEVVELGGLYVIGTERHDSRRIDNQLRGRTGRQGEPGETRFYVSMDDQIMRVLGGEVIQRLMSMAKMDEDMPIELRIFSKQIETAQKRVEGMNFDSRKRVVEYDDVMNHHREIFYSRRQNLLRRLENALGKFIKDDQVVDINLSENKERASEFEKLLTKAKQEVKEFVEGRIRKEADHIVDLNLQGKFNDKMAQELVKDYFTFVPEELLAKSASKSVLSLQKDIFEEVKNLKVEEVTKYFEDLTQKVWQDRLNEFKEDFYPLAKSVVLQQMDTKWVDHLEIMKDIKEGIGLQGYAQKDPLIEYQNKAFGIFDSFIVSIDAEIAKNIIRLRKVDATKQRIQTPVQIITNEDEVEDIFTGDREFLPGSQPKAKSVIQDIEAKHRKTLANLKSNAQSGSRTIKKEKVIGRNDKVTVKYSDGKIVKDVKYKKVMGDVESGRAELVNS